MKSVFKNKRTKVLLWVLLGAVVFALGVFAYGYSTGKLSSSASTTLPTFSDVPADHWAHDAIVTDVQFGLISGYGNGTFRPGNAVTRDQAAVFLARAVAGGDDWVPAGPVTASCQDVPTTNWSYKYVEYLITQGVINDDCTIQPSLDGPFFYSPSSNINRQEFAVMIARVVYGDNIPVANAADQKFSDVTPDNPAYDYIQFLSGEGIITGYENGTFRPDALVTRDQVAVFLYRALNLKEALEYCKSISISFLPEIIGIKRAMANVIMDNLASRGFKGSVIEGTLSGKVLDKVTNKPVADAEILLNTANTYGYVGLVTATTDSNGNYSVRIAKELNGVFTQKLPLFGTKEVKFTHVQVNYNITVRKSPEYKEWNTQKNKPIGFKWTKKNGVFVASQTFKLEPTGTIGTGTGTVTTTPGALTGAIKGYVCLKRSDASSKVNSDTDTYCNKLGYYRFAGAFAGSGREQNTFIFTLTPAPAGIRNGNIQAYVVQSSTASGGSYVVKYGNGRTTPVIIQAGTYRASNIQLSWPTGNGTAGAKATESSPASFTVISGKSTRVNFYVTW